MMEHLRALVVGLALAGLSCPAPKPQGPTVPPVTQAPDPHSPVCPPVGATCGCWFQPPGQGWQSLPACPFEPPAVTGCVLSGEPGPILDKPDATSSAAVNAAMAKRTGCSIGSRCILTVTLQQWQASIEAELRASGLCAGQHYPSTDEIAVATNADAIWQAYKIGAGDDSEGPVPPGGVPRTVVWFPGGARRAYLAPGGSSPAPTPPAPPSPTPPLPPSSGACPFAPCPIREWTRETLPDGWDSALIGKPALKINSATYAGGPDRDATPVTIRQLTYCQSIGYDNPNQPPRAECPMRPDGHPQREALEAWALYGGFQRQGRNGETAASCAPRHNNPAMFREGTGNCRQCNARPDGDPLQICTEWF